MICDLVEHPTHALDQRHPTAFKVPHVFVMMNLAVYTLFTSISALQDAMLVNWPGS